MATITYALSITHFVNSVGAKAGFAAIIGLALLILLFFTQSRETANLRRRADEAEQQLYQLQLHVEHLSRTRSQPTVAPAPAPAAAQTTSAPVAAPPAAALAARGAVASRTIPGERAEGGGVATLIPAAPAGVAAPALSSATRLIPLMEPDEISIRALKPSTNGGSNGDGMTNGTVVTPPPAPPPSTAAGGGNGVARTPVPVPMPTMAAAAEPAPPPRVALPRQPRQPMAPPPAPRRSGRGSSGRRISPVFLVLAGILVAAVVAVVLIFVTGSSNNSPSSSASSSAGSSAASASSTTAGKTVKSGGRRRTTAAPVTPSAVTVAVLNGTATNHLAADVLAKLTAAGYHGGTTQNASESSLTSTIVGYTSPSYRPDALAVAKSLNLGSASVQSVSQGDRSKVCGTTTTCPTQVVVTAGADLSQNG